MTLRVTPAEIVAQAEASEHPGLLARDPSWSRISLGDVAHVVNGAAFSSRFFNRDSRGLPLVRIRDVGTDKSDTYYDGPYETKHMVQYGDILVGMDGDFRVARWRGGTALLNQRVCKLEVDESRYSSQFMVLTLQGYLDAIWKATSSVTVKHLSSRSLAEIPLPLPSLMEQRRIVEILEDHLSRLDVAEAALDLASRRVDRWELAALWQETHVADARPVRLDSIAEVKLGRQRAPSNHSGVRMRPYLRAGNVHWNRLRLDDIKEMNFSEAEEAIFRLQRDDILVVEASGSAAEVGKSGIYRDEIPGACFQNTLLRVRCEKSSPQFVQKYLLAEALAGRLVQESRGVGIHHIGQARLAALQIAVPDEAVQGRMAGAADEVLAASRRLREEIGGARARGRTLRSALLVAAFTGRLTGRLSNEPVAQGVAGV